MRIDEIDTHARQEKMAEAEAVIKKYFPTISRQTIGRLAKRSRFLEPPRILSFVFVPPPHEKLRLQVEFDAGGRFDPTVVPTNILTIRTSTTTPHHVDYKLLAKLISLIKEIPYINLFKYDNQSVATLCETGFVNQEELLVIMQKQLENLLYMASIDVITKTYGRAGINQLTVDDLRPLSQSIMQQLKDEIGYED